MALLSIIDNLVHARRLAPASRLVAVELTIAGSATIADLMSRMNWTRPTLLSHLKALERERLIQRQLDGRTLVYIARKQSSASSKKDRQRVRAILRITRHADLSANERIVLLHLCLCAHHFHSAKDRAARLSISLSGYERARKGLRAAELVKHDPMFNAPLPKLGYRLAIAKPIRMTDHDALFKRCADLLWQANKRTGPTHSWWWQAFRFFSESSDIAPKDLLKLVFQIADHSGDKGFPRIHNPTQIGKHIPLLRKLRADMSSEIDRVLGD